MKKSWRSRLGCCTIFFLAARETIPGSCLESLRREKWVPLDLASTDQTTDVATGDGGKMIYISGYQQAPSDADGVRPIEALLMAYNSSGAQQWVVQYSTSGYDLGNSIAADSTGVYLAGTARAVHNTTGGADADDDTDAFVVKYNSTGGLLWERTWGTSEPDLGNGVAVDGGSGLVYVVGTTRGSMHADVLSPGSSDAKTSGSDGEAADTGEINAGSSDVFLTCLGAEEGNIRWIEQFGSSGADAGNRVVVGPRGGVFLVGQLGDDQDPSLAGARAFLAKYDYLGNSQFTARLNSTSAHYAVDLAASMGSGGEGVVYMSGYTMGDSATTFLARFEGSVGTQTWLSHFGAETGSPHLAQSVTVVEGSLDVTGAIGGAGSGSASGSTAPPGTPIVEDGGTEVGRDARVVLVGYNTSVASAETHESTGFTLAADTEGNWAWHAVNREADRETAITIGSSSRGGSADATSAFVVGTVSASQASPGNYLFLDIQEVVRVALPTPSPSIGHTATVRPTNAAHSIGDASTTTGLSQGASLWLLIIAPILVVASCILMVGYVSKQCAIAFGKSSYTENSEVVHYSTSDDHDREIALSSRNILTLRDGSSGSADGWQEGSLASSGVMKPGRRQTGRDGGKGTSWPRTLAKTFREKNAGPPYRKLGARGHARGRIGSEPREDDEGRGGDVELHQTTQHSMVSESPRSEGRAGGSSENIGDPAVESSEHGRLSYDRGLRGASRWDPSEHSAMNADEEAGSPNNGNPRNDEPMDAVVGSPPGSFDAIRFE